MKEYKRLTERHENGYIELMCNSCKYNDKCDVETHYCNKAAKNRLAELEDKIKNGTLKEVPCNVGDTIYFDTYRRGDSIGVQPHKVTRVRFVVGIEPDRGTPGTEIQEYEFGKSVFFTAEEAEAKLKKLQEKR